MSTNNMSVDKFNDFINKATEVLSCDSKCQEEKKRVDLKHKYLESKTNLLTAPSQVETSYKNYLTFTKGDSAFNEYKEHQLEIKAEKTAEIFKGTFHEAIENTKTSLKTYTGLLLNFTHVVEFYESLKKENVALSLEVKDTTSDLLTNDRKTFYEDQKIDSLYFYYKILLFIYVIVCGFYVNWTLFKLYKRMGEKGEPLKNRILIPLLLLIVFSIYPFLTTTIFYYIFKLYNLLISMLPKNVYTTI